MLVGYCADCGLTHELVDKRICMFNRKDSVPVWSTRNLTIIAKSPMKEELCELKTTPSLAKW